jgi:hypothetical protein
MRFNLWLFFLLTFLFGYYLNQQTGFLYSSPTSAPLTSTSTNTTSTNTTSTNTTSTNTTSTNTTVDLPIIPQMRSNRSTSNLINFEFLFNKDTQIIINNLTLVSNGIELIPLVNKTENIIPVYNLSSSKIKFIEPYLHTSSLNSTVIENINNLLHTYENKAINSTLLTLIANNLYNTPYYFNLPLLGNRLLGINPIYFFNFTQNITAKNYTLEDVSQLVNSTNFKGISDQLGFIFPVNINL